MPRTGSKVAEAIEAIHEKPRTTRELCTLLGCTCSAVRAMLLRPLSHGLIVKINDQQGRLHFASPQTARRSSLGKAEKKAPVASSRASVHGSNKPIAPVRQQIGKTHPPRASSATVSPCKKTRPILEAKPHGISSYFQEGELIIAVGGQSITLDTIQRQQLYSYLHKIRHIQ